MRSSSLAEGSCSRMSYVSDLKQLPMHTLTVSILHMIVVHIVKCSLGFSYRSENGFCSRCSPLCVEDWKCTYVTFTPFSIPIRQGLLKLLYHLKCTFQYCRYWLSFLGIVQGCDVMLVPTWNPIDSIAKTLHMVKRRTAMNPF